MIIIGKYNKTFEWYFATVKEVLNDFPIEPEFLRDISLEMLAQIDGITDLFNEYLILFNINGTPMFCTTGKDKLSDNVFL